MAETDQAGITSEVIVERFDKDGNLIESCRAKNIITQYGDQGYGERGAGVSGAQAAPTGMKLGTGSTSAGNAPAKTGTGAALTGYLTGSNKAFDATFPSSALNGSSRRIQYKRTYAAGEATSASPITEAVIVNETISNDDTSTSGETLARVALSGISAKGASDSLVVTWNHDLLGA